MKRIEPVNSNKIPEEEIVSKILNNFDMTPNGIINTLKLKEPIFSQTTNYGHLGKDNLNWKKIIEI